MKPPLSQRERISVGVLIIVFLALFLHAVSNILLPFVLSFTLAYILRPAMHGLEQLSFPRPAGAALIVVALLAVIAGVAIYLGPVLYYQATSLFSAFPGYIQQLQERAMPELSSLLSYWPGETKAPIDQVQREVGATLSHNVFSYLSGALNNMWNSGLAIAHTLSLLLITPFVTFYMLRDWNKITASLDSLLPRKYATIIREQVGEINKVLSGYLRGQLTVALILGIFYSISLTIAGLNFGIVIGMTTGLLSFIPYIGIITGFISGMVVAFIQYSDWQHIATIAAIFLGAQLAEGNFITPNLIGNKIGIHPAWLIFGLFAGGALLGFTGVLLAIPLTAVAGVLTRFLIRYYLSSSLYR